MTASGISERPTKTGMSGSGKMDSAAEVVCGESANYAKTLLGEAGSSLATATSASKLREGNFESLHLTCAILTLSKPQNCVSTHLLDES